MYDFDYVRPSTVSEAAALLNEIEGAKLVAGGATLVPVLKHRLANPPLLIDISGIDGLAEIKAGERYVSIGTMTRHFDVAISAIVKQFVPALAELASQIADPAIRNMGTIGGSLANNDPTADYPAACLALDAVIVTDKRRLKAEDFFQGLFTTGLAEDEVITNVLFPRAKQAAYVKFRNRASHYAMVGVFVARREKDVRVAVTGAGVDGVFRLSLFEEALGVEFSSRALAGLEVSAEGLNVDRNGSAEYRAHLIRVMAVRAVNACIG